MAGVAGRTALLTGAGSGIGRATAVALAKGGADVVVCDINSAGAEETAQALVGLGRKALAVRLDVTQLDAVQRAVAQAEAECGPLDIVFSNAGIGEQVAFTDMTETQWDRMFGVHLNGTYNCFQAALPGMRRRDWGRLISTSSMGAFTGGVRLAHYCAAKAGIAGLTIALASELTRTGITVNAVAPGLIDNILQAVEGRAQGSTVAGNISQTTAEQVRQFFLRRIPMRQLGKPEDIAHAHLFLASDEAGYVTGQVLSPNGGYVM